MGNGGDRRAVLTVASTGAHHRPGLVLLAACLGAMISMFNSTLVNVMVTDIGVDLGADDTALAWVSVIYTLTYGALLLLGGALGIRVGRRAAFLAGTVLFTVATVGCALAPGVGALLVGRLGQAVGVALLLPQTLSMIAVEYAGADGRARAVGLWAGVSSLGLCAGPVLGGLIVTTVDWRAGFGLSAVLGLVTLAVAWRGVPAVRHGRDDDAPPLDAVGAVLGALALAGLVFGLQESASLGWSSPWVPGALGLGAVAAAAFVAVQARIARRGGRPLMPLDLWRTRGLVTSSLAGLAYFFMFYGIIFYWALDLQRVAGRSALVTGLLFLPMTVVMALVGPVAGRLAARWRPEPVLVAGLTVAALGCLVLTLSGPGTLVRLELGLAVVGVGSGLMSSSMSTVAVSSVPPGQASTASAIHNTSRQIGSTLGVAVLGLVVAASSAGSPDDALSSGLPAAMGVVAALLASVAGAVALLRGGRA